MPGGEGLGDLLPHVVFGLDFQCLPCHFPKHHIRSFATGQEQQPPYIDRSPRYKLSRQSEALRLILPLELANGHHKLFIRENTGRGGDKINRSLIPPPVDDSGTSGMCHIHQPILRTGGPT